jgi:hypothetical protein
MAEIIGYRTPTIELFTHHDDAEIVEAERVLHENVHCCARLVGYKLNFTRAQRITHAVPEVLAGLLDRSDEGAAKVAAMTYLESRGYEVHKKGGK